MQHGRSVLQPLDLLSRAWAAAMMHCRSGTVQSSSAVRSDSTKKHPRFAYLSPLLKQSKTVAWDYLRAFRYLAMTSDGTVSVRNFSRRLEYPNLGIV